MRKKILLFLVLLVLLFSTVTLTAEEKDADPIVTRVFDVRPLAYLTFIQPNLLLDIIIKHEPEWEPPSYPTQKELIDVLIGKFTDEITGVAWKHDECYVSQDNGRLFIRNKRSVVERVEKWLAELMPRKNSYDIRFVVMARDGYDVQGAANLNTMTVQNAIEQLKSRGYRKETDVPLSIKPYAIQYADARSKVRYVADFEGLIAVFATALDPVIKEIEEGYELTFYLAEKPAAIEVGVGMVNRHLLNIRSLKTSTFELQLPDEQCTARQMSFNIGASEIGVNYGFSGGRSRVILVEVK